MTTDQFFTTGDGHRIAYRIEGPEDLPVLAFSNSIATDLHMWDRSVSVLGQSFRLLRYDFRGHGQSDTPAAPYSMDRLGRDVIELLDHLQFQKAHFLGLSLGGFVGQWLGIHAPERLGRLILSNTSPYLAGELPFNAQIEATLAIEDRSVVGDGFVANWFPRPWLSTPNAIVDDFHAMVVNTRAQGLAGCYAALRDVDFRRTNALITAPTLVIGGQDDAVTKPEHSEQIARAIPGSKLITLPGVHILNVEQPDLFHRAVLDFLG